MIKIKWFLWVGWLKHVQNYQYHEIKVTWAARPLDCTSRYLKIVVRTSGKMFAMLHPESLLSMLSWSETPLWHFEGWIDPVKPGIKFSFGVEFWHRGFLKSLFRWNCCGYLIYSCEEVAEFQEDYKKFDEGCLSCQSKVWNLTKMKFSIDIKWKIV
jgi:hypothetical protein